MIKPSNSVNSLEAYKITPQDVWAAPIKNELVKLDWNEAPFDFRFYQSELRRVVTSQGFVSWYPDYLATKLTEALSIHLRLDPNLILTFPGSDVAIETICRAFLDPTDRVLALTPTYENFFVFCQQTGANLFKVHLPPPFEPDTVQLTQQLEKNGPFKLVYLVSPNNPCGYVLDRQSVKLLLERFPETLFVIDEAYIEFSDEPSFYDLTTYQNIIITRTFSKAFGLAGLRLGYVIGDGSLLRVLNKIRNGKNISMLAQHLGHYALINFRRIQNWVDEVKFERERFSKWLTSEGIANYPSQGNFILFHAKQPDELTSELKAEGIYLRNRTSMLPGAIRLTIGGKKHMPRVTEAFRRKLDLLR